MERNRGDGGPIADQQAPTSFLLDEESYFRKRSCASTIVETHPENTECIQNCIYIR